MSHGIKWKTGAVVILAALGILLPEIVSAGWHVAHGRSIDFRAWKITVPFGWYAMRHGEGMTVERMSRLSWRKGPVATFLPVHFTKTYRFDYAVFGSVQRRVLRSNGYLFVAQKDIQVGGQGGKCWTYVSAERRDQQWIACVVPGDLTSVDYIGPAAYSNSLFSLLQNITREKSAD